MKTEIKRTAVVSAPLVVAELAHISMVFTDAFLFSLLGVDKLAGGGLGTSMLHFITIVSMGLVAGVSNLVAVAYGADRKEEINTTVKAGILLALALFGLALLVVSLSRLLLLWLGQEDALVHDAYAYMSAAVWSVLPLLVLRVLRGLSVGIGHTTSILNISLLGASLNLPLSYWLMRGGLGVPALGVIGIGIATSVVSLTMCLAFAVDIYRREIFKPWRFWLFATPVAGIRNAIRKVLRMGVPIGIAYGMESGLFTIAAIFAGQLGSTALAAHQIALHCSIVAFRVPAAIAQGTSVLVGQSLGAAHLDQVKRYTLSGLMFGLLFSLASSVVFLLFPEPLVGLFTLRASTEEIAVATTAVGLLAIVAAFQLADCWQVIAMGALRGLHQAHAPTLVAITGYWLAGLPAAYYLASTMGIEGIWWGLALGLLLTALMLLLLLRQVYQRLVAIPPAAERNPAVG